MGSLLCVSIQTTALLCHEWTAAGSADHIELLQVVYDVQPLFLVLCNDKIRSATVFRQARWRLPQHATIKTPSRCVKDADVYVPSNRHFREHDSGIVQFFSCVAVFVRAHVGKAPLHLPKVFGINSNRRHYLQTRAPSTAKSPWQQCVVLGVEHLNGEIAVRGVASILFWTVAG